MITQPPFSGQNFLWRIFICCFILICFNFGAASQTFFNAAPDLGISALPQTINFGSGMSFYDFDNDGWDDLSFTMTNDSLVFYRNTGSGFELLPSFVNGEGETKSLLWVDYDNDGDLDLAIAINFGTYKLFRNDGDFNFTDVSDEVGLYSEVERFYGLSFCDYDKDGFLDFYVCVYALGPGDVPFYSKNKLYHNKGDGTFEEVSEAAGVDDGVRLSFQSVWFDYDMDGWVDLFIINDRLYENSLYKNNGDGTFTDVSEEAGIKFGGQDPMTASVADYDHDGDLDIYLSNTGVPNKMPKLLRNNGDGTFTDVAQEAGLFLSSWTWAGVWFDYNNNTHQDLYVCSANPNPANTIDPNFFYANNGEGTFTLSNEVFLNNINQWSFSSARGDYNNDGYYDIAVLNKDPHDVMLWLNSGGDNNYIKMTLHGTASNNFAIGSWIKVFAGGNQYTQWTMCGENYLGQNSQHHIFGLAQYEVVDSVQVTYSLGHTDTYYDLEVNQWYQFYEGDTYLAEILADGPLVQCEGESIILDAGEHATYLWDDDSEERYREVDITGTYTVTVTNEFGVSQTVSIDVELTPYPVLLESFTNVSCFGAADGSAHLQNEMGVDPDLVLWSNGLEGEALNGLDAGVYSYTYTDINGCGVEGSIEITQPQEIQISTFSFPEVNNGGDGAIVVFAAGAIQPFTVFIDGVEVPGGTLQELHAGTYEVVVIDANGCEASTQVEVELIVSVGEALQSNDVKVFPNPAKDHCFILAPTQTRSLEIKLISSNGQTIDHFQFNSSAQVSLPLDLPSGQYFVQVMADGVISTHRLSVVE